MKFRQTLLTAAAFSEIASAVRKIPQDRVIVRPSESIQDFPDDFCINKPDGNYPDPEDCGSFASCSGEVLWILHCPDNLNYNPNRNKCEYLDISNCNPNRLRGPTRPDQASIQDVPDDFCDSRPDGDYPDPEDCRSYIICSYGQPHVLHCPADLCYNPNIDSCDYQDAVDCPNHIEGLGRPTRPGRAVISEASQHIEKVDPNFCCDKKGSTYGNPKDCHETVYCAGGRTISMLCPGDLYYDPADHRCGTKDNVTCATPAVDADFCSGKESGPYGNPENCTEIVYCAGGKSISMPCPGDTYYDPADHRCGDKDNVTCATYESCSTQSFKLEL